MPQFFWNQQHSEGLLHCNSQQKCCQIIQDFNLFKESILVHSYVYESDIHKTQMVKLMCFWTAKDNLCLT